MFFPKLSILAPMAALICGATSLSQKAAGYADPRGRFSLNAPAGWTATQMNEDAVFFAHGSAYVSVMVFPGEMAPAEVIHNMSQQMSKQWTGFVEVLEGKPPVSGHTGLTKIYRGRNPQHVEAFANLIAVAAEGNTFVMMQMTPQSDFVKIKPDLDTFLVALKISSRSQAPAPDSPSIGDVPTGQNGQYRNPITGETVQLPAGRKCYVNQKGEYYVVTRPGDDPNVSQGGKWFQLTPVNAGASPNDGNDILRDPAADSSEPGANYRPIDDRSGPFGSSRTPERQSTPSVNRTGRTGSLTLFRTAATQDQAGLCRGAAYTFLVPQNWNAQSGIIWRSIPSSPSTSWVRMTDPATGSEIGILPEITFTWSDYLARYFRQGQLYEGNEMQPLVTDPFRVARQFVIPRLRPQLARARVVDQRSLPELADALCGKYSGGTAASRGCSAGKIRFEYEEGGRVWEEDLYISLGWAVLNVGTIGPGTQVALWSPHEVRYSKAEKGKLNDQIRLFQMVNLSYRPTLQFYNQRQQLIQNLVGQRLAAGTTGTGGGSSSSALELSRYIARSNDSVSAGIRSSYENRQQVTSRAAYNYDRAIRGVDEWQNPHTGEVVPLPTGYENGWVNNQGQFVAGMPGDDPNVTLGGNWTPMKRYRP